MTSYDDWKLESPPEYGERACNADIGHRCECGRCEDERAYWADQYANTPESVRRLDLMTAEELDAELKEAGRR